MPEAADEEPRPAWGPWREDAPDVAVRRAVLVLYTQSGVVWGHDRPLTLALGRADREEDPGRRAAALRDAARELDHLPALTRRRLLAHYGRQELTRRRG